jgi:hypothetical protein
MVLKLHPEPGDLVTTDLGELGIFWISAKDHSELLSKLGGTVTKSSPIELARTMLPFLCHPIESLQGGKYKPDSPTLRDEDVSKISDDEIEEIIHKYIIYTERLFPSPGKNTKEHDETYVQYLYRLSLAEENKYRKQNEQLKASILGATHFSQYMQTELSAIRRFSEEVNRHQELMRAALGPMEELRRSPLFELESPLQQQMAQIHQSIATYEANFRLLRVTEIPRFIEQMRNSSVPVWRKSYQNEAMSIQRAIEAMKSPWLDTRNALRSFSGFAELQGIGQVTAIIPPFL